MGKMKTCGRTHRKEMKEKKEGVAYSATPSGSGIKY
jgi:hypothetical protein